MLRRKLQETFLSKSSAPVAKRFSRLDRFIERTPYHMWQWAIGVNVGVFLMWKVYPFFMQRHFMYYYENVRSGRLHTLVTNSFSHFNFFHLLVNMIGIYFFGQTIERYYGPKMFIYLYLAGALGGSLLMLLRDMTNAWKSPPALGASTATFALTTFFILRHPNETIYLYFLIPVPAWACGIGLFAFTVLSVDESGSMNSLGHLGGMLGGAAIYYLRRIGRL
jgi:membrane associated rhomboid family serine protease